MKIIFPIEPEYIDLPDGQHRKLINDVIIQLGTVPYLIPAGFVTDGASVPRILWNIIPPFGQYNKAALLHDHLYKTQKYPRNVADQLFLDAMAALKVPRMERAAMYSGVRIGGWVSWNKYEKEIKAGIR